MLSKDNRPSRAGGSLWVVQQKGLFRECLEVPEISSSAGGLTLQFDEITKNIKDGGEGKVNTAGDGV